MVVPPEITSVWEKNFMQELIRFDYILHTHQYIAFDTEFPGCIRTTPRNASEVQRYDDLKYNVDRTKLIQLGVTLFDVNGSIGGIWEFNFWDFDVDTDLHVPSSIQLLRNNGIDFEKTKKEGILEAKFAKVFGQILSHHKRLHWVTFHGLYDFAYVLNLMTRKYLPLSVEAFAQAIGEIFGNVYDVKYICRFCAGLLGGELGLEKLAKILNVERVGEAHQAGSDSLLTATIFFVMMQNYQVSEILYRGCLYGMGARITRRIACIVPVTRPQIYPVTRPQVYQRIVMPYPNYLPVAF